MPTDHLYAASANEFGVTLFAPISPPALPRQPGRKIVRKFLVQVEFPETAEICGCDTCQKLYSSVLAPYLAFLVDNGLNHQSDPLRLFPQSQTVTVTEEA